MVGQTAPPRLSPPAVERKVSWRNGASFLRTKSVRLRGFINRPCAFCPPWCQDAQTRKHPTLISKVPRPAGRSARESAVRPTPAPLARGKESMDVKVAGALLAPFAAPSQSWGTWDGVGVVRTPGPHFLTQRKVEHPGVSRSGAAFPVGRAPPGQRGSTERAGVADAPAGWDPRARVRWLPSKG